MADDELAVAEADLKRRLTDFLCEVPFPRFIESGGAVKIVADDLAGWLVLFLRDDAAGPSDRRRAFGQPEPEREAADRAALQAEFPEQVAALKDAGLAEAERTVRFLHQADLTRSEKRALYVLLAEYDRRGESLRVMEMGCLGGLLALGLDKATAERVRDQIRKLSGGAS